ncbi:LamG domain-containing protein [Natronosalvus vescus]|uniref:LamG domain-containing protein n=1 Tax=Natronosalvus vescus TaxID=2953881 RepID=UPI002091CFA8|nr:LamG domain-containing protein [Natronosalvus vescus]
MANYNPADPPGSTINLGNVGLSEGDRIDPYLDEYLTDGVHIIVPQGTYTTANYRSWNLTGISSDTILEGDGLVTIQLEDPPIDFDPQWGISSSSSNVTFEFRNFRFEGGVADSGTLTPYSDSSSGTLVFDRIERPDGVHPTHYGSSSASGYYVHGRHTGELWIIDNVVQNFADNGAYFSSPGRTYESYGNGGSTHIRGGLFRNNAISQIRPGGPNDSVIGCTIVQDSDNPYGSGHRSLWVREPGDNIHIEDVDIALFDEYGRRPLQITPRDASIVANDGYVGNCRLHIDESGTTDLAVRFNEDRTNNWTGEGIHITGNGTKENELGGTECSGAGCDIATSERRWWGDQSDDSTNSPNYDEDPYFEDPDNESDYGDNLTIHSDDEILEYEIITNDIIVQSDWSQATYNETVGIHFDGSHWHARGTFEGEDIDGFFFDGEIVAIRADREPDGLFVSGEEISIEDYPDEPPSSNSVPQVRYDGELRHVQRIGIRSDGGLQEVSRAEARVDGEVRTFWPADGTKGSSSPLVEGLVSQYDAQSLTGTDDGERVGSWTDSAGSSDAVQLSSENRPAYDSSGLNSSPALRFDGDEWLQTDEFGDDLTQPFTYIVVAQADEPDGGNFAFGGRDSEERAFLDMDYDNAFTMWSGASGGIGQSNDDNAHVFTCVFNGSESALHVDGAVVEGAAGSNDQVGLTIGARHDGGKPMRGWISELRVYDRELALSERNALAYHLGDKWGIPLEY